MREHVVEYMEGLTAERDEARVERDRLAAQIEKIRTIVYRGGVTSASVRRDLMALLAGAES